MSQQQGFHLSQDKTRFQQVCVWHTQSFSAQDICQPPYPTTIPFSAEFNDPVLDKIECAAVRSISVAKKDASRPFSTKYLIKQFIVFHVSGFHQDLH